MALKSISAVNILSQRDSGVSKISEFREYLTSLSMGILDIFSGLTATLLLIYIGKVPWIIALLPILLTVRGDLAGSFTGVLTTSLHIGTIKPNFRNNSSEYYSLIFAIYTLSFSNGVIASLLILIYRSINRFANFVEILYITLATFQISSLVSIFVTSIIAFFIYRFGLDPDIYVYPIISIINDVLVSIIIIFVLELLKPWNIAYFYVMGAFVISTMTILLIIGVLNFGNEYRYKKTLKEAYLAVLFGIIMSSINGVLLSESTSLILEYRILLIIYPAFIATLGNQAVILASQTTTALHTYIVEPKFSSFLNRDFGYRIALIIFASMIVYSIILIIASIFSLDSYPKIPIIWLIIIVSSLIVYILIIVPISIIVAIQTFKKGWDPDNVLISIITTFSDFLGTYALIGFSNLFLHVIG